MSPPSLYVCEAARGSRYRHENLHILAAERGRVVEGSYNPIGVATELLDDGARTRGGGAPSTQCSPCPESRGDDPYRSSVFFRPIGTRVGDELQEVRRLPLKPGAHAALTLHFYNPHLSEVLRGPPRTPRPHPR